jgi:hypothetical protein
LSSGVAAIAIAGWLVLPVSATGSGRLSAVGPDPTTQQQVTPQQQVAATASTPVPVIFPTEIDVIGDSLTVGIEPYLPALVKPYNIPVRIDARVSRRTSDGLTQLTQMAPVPGAVVVMALGTNDADLSSYSAYIDAVMAKLPDALRVVWLTVQRPGGEPHINAAIQQAAITYAGRLIVADWASELLSHPEYLGGAGPHCTPAGYQARAAFILGAALGIPISPQASDAPGTGSVTYVQPDGTTSSTPATMAPTTIAPTTLTTATTAPATTEPTTSSTSSSTTSSSTTTSSTPPTTEPTTTTTIKHGPPHTTTTLLPVP